MGIHDGGTGAAIQWERWPDPARFRAWARGGIGIKDGGMGASLQWERWPDPDPAALAATAATMPKRQPADVGEGEPAGQLQVLGLSAVPCWLQWDLARTDVADPSA